MIINNLDRLVFGDITMTVCHNHFYNYGSGHHDDMVESLFGSVDKWSFCRDAYGYTSSGGIFPNYKDHDFGAAYRVAEKIYTKILCQGTKIGANVGLSYSEAVKHVERNGITEFIIDFSNFEGGSISNSKGGLFFGMADTRISSYDGDCNYKNSGKFDFDYEWISAWEDSYTGLFELVGERDTPESDLESKLYPISGSYKIGIDFPDEKVESYNLMSSIKRAEGVNLTRLPSDHDTLTKGDIYGTAISPSRGSTSCAKIPQETPDKCCTSEKRKRKRFKIQDFLNDRDRK